MATKKKGAGSKAAPAKKTSTPKATTPKAASQEKKEEGKEPGPTGADPGKKDPEKADQGENDEEKPKRKQQPNPIKRIKVPVKVPGSEQAVSVTMFEVEYNGEKFQADKRKECAEWYTRVRAENAQRKRDERQAAREQAENERMVVMYPLITARLEGTASRLEKLKKDSTVTADQLASLNEIIAAIGQVVADRNAQDPFKKSE